MKTRLPLCLGTVLLVAGCSSEPTMGDKMLSQAGGTQEMGSQWKKGNSLVIKGNKMKEKGQELIEEGHDKIDEGEDMIAEGQKMMKDSEAAYKLKFPNNTLN